MRIASLLTALTCMSLPLPDSGAHDLHPPLDRWVAVTAPQVTSPLWVGPAYSGSWFTSSRSGEGFTLQILDNGSALVIWFTYPPAGSAAKQAWIMALDGKLDGDRIRFDNAFTTRGPRFGSTYDPSQLVVVPWGTIEFQFTGCNAGTFSYSGPPGWGSGTRPLTRLTAISELECTGKHQLQNGGARSLSGLKGRTGSWFDPTHNGEGWQVEELPDGRVQVYWFTYDTNGAQAWTLGTAAKGGDHVDVDQNLQPVGTNFGADFDSASVKILPWGRLTLQFDSCDAGVASYDASLPAFGSGSLKPVRLSRVAGTACLASEPAAPTGGTWSAGATMPTPQSEYAGVTVDGKRCALSGFGDVRGFRCYDLATNAWSSRANMPVSRDHAEAVNLGSEVLFTGGYATDLDGPQNITGWRYRIADDKWEAVPQLPDVSASSGAALAGFAYFTGVSGFLYQVNPRTLAVRAIPGDNTASRDHSQLVAFQGELWLMGGRNIGGVANGRVSIFDPASETWREGPTMGSARSGFAAAASDTTIVVAGGERLDAPPRTLSDVEAFVAGGGSWNALPPLPFAMHGFGGALQGNTFFTLGGSRVAGGISNGVQVQVYHW